MRRLLVAVAVAGSLVATSVYAEEGTDTEKVHVVGQTDDAPLNAIGVQLHSGLGLSPTGYTAGVAIKYERAFSDMVSLAIQPGLQFATGATAFGVDLDLRFHIVGESLNGLYIGPTAGFWLYSAGGIAPGFDAGAIIGYSYLINNMVQIGIGVGFTYNAIILPTGLAGNPTIPIRAGVSFAF